MGFVASFVGIVYPMVWYRVSREREREREISVFDNKSRSSKELIEDIIREVGSWLLTTPEFKGFPLSLFLKDWVSSLD